MSSARDLLLRNKWFVVVVIFLFVNIWGWLHCQKPRLSPLPTSVVVVMDQHPKPYLKSNEVVGWAFSEPMVATSNIGKNYVQGPVSFRPAVTGVFRWITSQRLEFRPDATWRGCSMFSAVIDPKLLSVAGHQLAAQKDYPIQTAPLELLSASQADVSSDQKVTIRLDFSDPITPAALEQYMALTTTNGQTINWKVRGNVASRTILVETENYPGETVQLNLRPGLTSLAGPLGVTQPITKFIACSDKLSITELIPEAASFENGSIRFRSSMPLDLDNAASFVKVVPKTTFSVEPYCCYPGHNEYRLAGEFQPGQIYTIVFQKGLPTADKLSLEKDVKRQVYFPDRPAAITFRIPGQYISRTSSLLLPITTVNTRQFKVIAQRIYPNNLVHFALRETKGFRYFYESPAEGLGQIIAEKAYEVRSTVNVISDTVVRLKDLLGSDARGAYWITASADPGGTVGQLVIISDIGVTAQRASNELLVWVNDLHTLAAISNAEVHAYSEANQELFSGKTDDQGLARFRQTNATNQQPYLVTVQLGDDLTYLPLASSRVNVRGDLSGIPYPSGSYEAYLFADRGIFRPGETGHVVAVVRGPAVTCPSSFPVELEIIRPDGKPKQTIPALLDNLGVASFTIKWEDYDSTGNYELALKTPGGTNRLGNMVVALEEFVPPQIAVEVTGPTNRATPTNGIKFEVQARRLFGPPAAGNQVQAEVNFVPSEFTAVDWPGYIFSDNEKAFKPVRTTLSSTNLDAAGHAVYSAAISAAWRPPSALEAIIGATVLESGGRGVAATTRRRVDVYPFYLGIKIQAEGGALKVGQSYQFAFVTLQPSGMVLTALTNAEVSVARESWSTVLQKEDSGHYSYKSVRQLQNIAKETIKLENGTGRYAFTPAMAGQYIISIKDNQTGVSASIPFYAGTADQEWLTWSMETPDQLKLFLDKDKYEIGDQARLIVQAPYTGKLLLTLVANHILETRVISLDKNTAEITIPVSSNYAPNIYCLASLIRAVAPGERWAAHRAVGALPLNVKTPQRHLKVQLTAPTEGRPMTNLAVEAAVTDQLGMPVQAEVVVAAVDEGICQLTDFITPDPASYYCGQREMLIELFDLYSLLMPELEEGISGTPSTPGGGAAERLSRRLNPIKVRRFKPVALWDGVLKCSTNGHVSATFNVPEFSGELRLMAVAIDKTAFGSANQKIIIRRPLTVTSSLPRFLAPEDTCAFPVEIFNGTGRDGVAEVTVSTTGALEVAQSVGREYGGISTTSIPIGSGQHTSVCFEIRAVRQPGAATLRLQARLNEESYAESFELAVRPPAAEAAIFSSAAISAGQSTNWIPQGQWLPGTGHCVVDGSGLASADLAGSLSYLLDYPYGCLEQSVSSAFPLLYLADLAAQLRPGSIISADVTPLVKAGIYRIISMQLANGGFACWPNTTDVDDWGSIYATHFLVEATKAGYAVPGGQFEAACGYLHRLLAQPVRNADNVDSSAWKEDMELRSYASLVLALAGQADAGWIARLNEQMPHLGLSAQLNVVGALAVSGQRRSASDLLAKVNIATPTESSRNGAGCFNSSTRSAAIILSLWLDLDPENPAVLGLVQRLKETRIAGRWDTTQDNALAVMALGQYYRRVAQDHLPFVACIHCASTNNVVVFDQDHPAHVELAEAPVGGVLISNAGPGTAYLFMCAKGIPMDAELEERDSQIKVRRQLLDSQGNVVQNREFRQGELVVVEWTLEADRFTDNIVVEDLLPAGLEVENAQLKTALVVPWAKEKSSLPLRHLETRDDRVLGFVGEFSGTKKFYYTVRAVSKGSFDYPAIKASCMYDSGISSINGRGHVSVK